MNTSISTQTDEIPTSELVAEVYEHGSPVLQSQILTQLVGRVYTAAPLSLRSRLLEQLMRPLGVLSLVAIADGLFAKIRFRSGWPDVQVALEDAQRVQASDVAALVDHVQQVSIEALDGVAQLLMASPLITSSAAATVLVALLLKRARSRRASDADLPELAR